MTNGCKSPRPPSRLAIAPARSDADLRDVAALFARYAESLPVDLGYQDFRTELSTLPGKYAPPAGELLLARDERGQPCGCAGLRPLAGPGLCEMKRLYTVTEARGLGLGLALIRAAIDHARQRGYREVRLDTLPSMTRAAALYRRLGFETIEPYYEPTPSGTAFMALRL